MRAWIQKVVLCAALLCLYGCAPNVTIPFPTLAPTYTPTIQNTSTPTSIYNAYWKEFREPGDGWGIAVPVNWLTLPAYDFDEDFNHVAVQNYDNIFFESKAGRDAWREWALKVSVKLEIFKDGGYGEYDTLEEGIKDRRGSSETAELVEINTDLLGKTKFVSYLMRERVSGMLSLHYAFKINQFEILIWSCYPNSSWERKDIQGILASIAISHDDEIIYPDIKPGEFYTFLP